MNGGEQAHCSTILENKKIKRQCINDFTNYEPAGCLAKHGGNPTRSLDGVDRGQSVPPRGDLFISRSFHAANRQEAGILVHEQHSKRPETLGVSYIYQKLLKRDAQCNVQAPTCTKNYAK
jgi:hypothetical protein